MGNNTFVINVRKLEFLLLHVFHNHKGQNLQWKKTKIHIRPKVVIYSSPHAIFMALGLFSSKVFLLLER